MSEDTARSPEADNRFLRDYAAGILDEDPEIPAAADRAEEAVAMVPPAEPIALRGCVLAPDGPIEDGYVVVGTDGTISGVQTQRPDSARICETSGVILPGLIDLHGHPEHNIFAAWEPPQQFINRYEWRNSEVFDALVTDTQRRLKQALPPETQTRYAELRALVGGVTAIQGATPRYPTLEALVRNVDRRIFGQHRARTLIDLPSHSSREFPAFQRTLQQIDAGQVTALYIHLAEGRRDNERSRRELAKLVELGGLTPATIIIHGTALDRQALHQVKDAGAKLVWSPQSNLRLYGETTLAGEALALGIPVGLGADWLPSGSPSLLAELKIVRRELARQGHPVSSERLVKMVTSEAAEIAGLGRFLGVLEENRPADVLVLERRRDDPWENVVEADPSWVELVLIGGDLTYGRADWMEALADPGPLREAERVLAWGKPMILDTSYAVKASATPPPRLRDLRATLTAHYPPVGPIFA